MTNKTSLTQVDDFTTSAINNGNRCEMCNEIDRITSRHIAKLLCRLGSLIPPVAEQEIKRQFRFFSDDIKRVIQGDENGKDDNSFNR